MLKVIVAVVIGLTLSACKTGPTEPAEIYPVSISLDAKLRSSVERGISQRLKDPDSARFGAMNAGRKIENPSKILVCGYVNAKNSFGGYTGARPFIAYLNKSGGNFVFGESYIGSDKNGRVATINVCSEQRVPVPAL